MPAAQVLLRNREEAGDRLAERLADLESRNPLVVALPRGGVPVGSIIARALRASLDILIVRKVGAPDNPEYGLGALAEDGTVVLDRERMRESGYSEDALGPIIREERKEAHRRGLRYRSVRAFLARAGRTVILVDDGAATGGTLRTALQVTRAQGAAFIVVALGVAPPDVCRVLEREADRIEVLLRPQSFYAVGQFYRDFEPVSDEEVLALLGSNGVKDAP